MAQMPAARQPRLTFSTMKEGMGRTSDFQVGKLRHQ